MHTSYPVTPPQLRLQYLVVIDPILPAHLHSARPSPPESPSRIISILTLLDQIQNTTSATIPSRSHSSLPLFSLSVFSTRAAASVIQMRTVARRGSDAGTVSMYLVRITICICRPAYSVRACPLPFYAPNSARQYGRHAQDSSCTSYVLSYVRTYLCHPLFRESFVPMCCIIRNEFTPEAACPVYGSCVKVTFPFSSARQRCPFTKCRNMFVLGTS